MANYQHILVAVDFFAQSDVVIAKAQLLASRFQAKLSLIHVVDSVPITDTGYSSEVPFSLDLTAQLLDSAKLRLAELAEQLHLTKEQQFLEIGSPKAEIVRIAKEHEVDLIVVGSHGRHGLALLLGSTANSVLHYAPCDVLAVRLFDEE